MYCEREDKLAGGLRAPPPRGACSAAGAQAPRPWPASLHGGCYGPRRARVPSFYTTASYARGNPYGEAEAARERR